MLLGSFSTVLEGQFVEDESGVKSVVMEFCSIKIPVVSSEKHQLSFSYRKKTKRIGANP